MLKMALNAKKIFFVLQPPGRGVKPVGPKAQVWTKKIGWFHCINLSLIWLEAKLWAFDIVKIILKSRPNCEAKWQRALFGHFCRIITL